MPSSSGDWGMAWYMPQHLAFQDLNELSSKPLILLICLTWFSPLKGLLSQREPADGCVQLKEHVYAVKKRNERFRNKIIPTKAKTIFCLFPFVFVILHRRPTLRYVCASCMSSPVQPKRLWHVLLSKNHVLKI